eukprot:11950453-Alexandrium_andersonii.AAC.1
MASQKLSLGWWGPSLSIWALRPQRAASSALARALRCVRRCQLLARTSALPLAVRSSHAPHLLLRR